MECGLTDTRMRVVESSLMSTPTVTSEPMLSYVRVQLDSWKGRWTEVAAGTDLSKRTIEKIASREIADPGVSRVQKLHDWFRAQERATT